MKVRRRSAFVISMVAVVALLAGCSNLDATSASSTTLSNSHHASTTQHSSSAKQGQLAPGDHTVTLTFSTRTRTLILHVPPAPVVANRPLILVYHGADDTASGTEQETDFNQVADSNGELVAYMQGYDDTWNEGAGHTPAEQAHVNDVAFTSAAIAKLETLVTFDHSRIVAVGFSNGALMVQDLGCHLASKLALIVPVEGELPVTVAATCAPARPLSVLEIHATADSQIPYNGGPFVGIGGGTTVLSAPKSVARWAVLDGCPSTPSTTNPSSAYSLTTYSSCNAGTSVTLRTINGGSHEWGSNIGQLVTAALPS